MGTSELDALYIILLPFFSIYSQSGLVFKKLSGHAEQYVNILVPGNL
jgi:hypothetical protein